MITVFRERFQQLLETKGRELAPIAGILTGEGYYRRMRRVVVYMALMAGGALVLAGCGLADSRSPVPEFMRAKASDPPPPEPPPDVKQLVRKNLDSVFVAASAPQDVRVSSPRRDPRGSGWTACVKAELTSAMGKPLGTQTYRVTISTGIIIDRRRLEAADDNCASEAFEPI
jgi:hypothetical protein